MNATFFHKYLLLLFLIANTTAEYILFMSVSKYLFYAVLGISVPFLFNKAVISPASVAKCPHIYALGGILLFYQLLFGWFSSSPDAMVYLIGKIATFGIMMLCISENYEFYWKKSIIYFSYIILALIILGWFVNRTGYSPSGRLLTFGFANRNAGCAIASIGFAGFLFGNKKFKRVDYICMAMLFLSVLMGGSRNSLTMCLIFIIIRFGLSLRLTIVIALLVVTILFILPELGIKIMAFERLVGTVTGKVASDREAQRIGAMMMIEAEPWKGWGLASKIQGEALAISRVGAHNGYLTLLMYMGYPLGIVFIATIIIGVIKRLKLYFLKDNFINYHLAVMLSVLFAANQEDFLVGVNQIITNMFYVSFVVTGIFIYYYKNNLVDFSDEEE